MITLLLFLLLLLFFFFLFVLWNIHGDILLDLCRFTSCIFDVTSGNLPNPVTP